MIRTGMLAALLASTTLFGVHAQEQLTLKFWDNQQTESGLSQYQKETVVTSTLIPGFSFSKRWTA